MEADYQREHQERFRRANETLRDRARRLVAGDELVPFLCECPDARCTQVLLLTDEEYRNARAGEARFLVAPGHDLSSGETVVRAEERFWLTERRRTAEDVRPNGSAAAGQHRSARGR